MTITMFLHFEYKCIQNILGANIFLYRSCYDCIVNQSPRRSQFQFFYYLHKRVTHNDQQTLEPLVYTR